MDKAEYRIATEHIKKLISQGEYAEASYIADTIDWRRVKSVMMLCTVSDLYKVNRRFQDAKELLYMAYERNPESRTILYSLCDLSIKLEEFVAAIEYYKSFVEVAPKDTGRYVLQYRLYQAQDVSLEERIEVLEQLKSEEYIEKWAYELAYLYHRIGFSTKCVEECDELILWFGKGRYVYKAMELKMLHEPLTPSQQQVYDHRFEQAEQSKDMTRVLPRIDSGEAGMTDESMVDVTDAPTVEIPQEYLEKELPLSADSQVTAADEIQVKTLDVANAYNTMNLQKELADSLKEILEVSHTESAAIKEQESYTDTDVTADKRIEEAMPALVHADSNVNITEVVIDIERAQEEVVPQRRQTVINVPEPSSAKLMNPSKEEKEDAVPEVISEQISIQQILPDIFRLPEPKPVSEQITGQLNIEDILAEWSKQEEKAREAHQEGISERIKSQTQDIFAAIEAEMRMNPLDHVEYYEELAEASDYEEIELVSTAEPEMQPMEHVPEAEAQSAEEMPELDVYLTESVSEPEAQPVEDVPEPEMYLAEGVSEPEAQPVEEMPEPEMYLTEDVSESEAQFEGEKAESEAQPAEDVPQSEPELASSPSPIDKKLYKTFLRTGETEGQIAAALEGASMQAPLGNVRVTGHDLSVCFEFAKTMMTDLKEKGFALNGKTAKISAVNLNKKEPSEIISKVRNGVLIIERAGRLRKEAVEKLSNYLQTRDLQVLVFITDTEHGMKHFIEKYPIMGQLFELHVNIKDYSEDELLEYAVQYAYNQEYGIEEMGKLALRTRIELLIANESAPTMADARRIVEEAIEHANRKTFKHFIDILLRKRYDAEDMIVLREEDFGAIQ